MLCEPDIDDERGLRFVHTHGVGLFEVGACLDESGENGVGWIRRLEEWRPRSQLFLEEERGAELSKASMALWTLCSVPCKVGAVEVGAGRTATAHANGGKRWCQCSQQ